ncbi:hypothetical protein [Algoriphagus boritolerans]|uniref:PepSY domain-containing protein n=1 Tax=Algoriphagus boritolerans DSM 17298 = JCM 18970 TaxID=1120964 RepID=A0A1H6A704_9BACT|nr:hypothetical protein [Algoriphagus boritolerans]SEG44513.1 hypothetical protein SAMN03080598_03965 [Algoriphagus boritolerans DSM 17298 = JCM 18970]
MKKIYAVLVLLTLLSVAFSCSVEDDTDPLDVFREIAYNALSSDIKSTVVGDWRDAEVSAWVDGNYLVIFETSDAALGPVKVVVDPERGTWVEILPRP